MSTRLRSCYLLLMMVVVGFGVGSRSSAVRLPPLIATYAGDTMWALFVFLGVRFVTPSASTAKVAAIAAGLALGVEVSQWYHAPWIDAIRQTWVGGLALGSGFLWSDLVCYGVGIAVGMFIEFVIQWV